jgi:acetyl esterase/lipase
MKKFPTFLLALSITFSLVVASIGIVLMWINAYLVYLIYAQETSQTKPRTIKLPKTFERVQKVNLALMQQLSIYVDPKYWKALIDYFKFEYFSSFCWHKTVKTGGIEIDLFWPKTKSSKPVILFIYGGAWMNGSKTIYRSVGFSLAEKGYTVLIPEYRTFPTVSKVSDMLDDIDMTVSWLFQNIQKYSGDLSNVTVVGHSAGAHLTAMAFLTARNKGKECLKRIRNILLIGGVYDIPKHFEYEYSRGVEEISAMGRVMGPTAKEWEKNSPLFVLKQDKSSSLITLLHGKNDQTVPYGQSFEFYKSLKQLGYNAKLVSCHQASHTCHLLSLLSPTFAKETALNGEMVDIFELL